MTGSRIDRHHVVVAVDQHGFGLRIDDLLGIDHRIPGRGHHLGTVGAGLDQCSGEELGAALHVGFMLRLGADRRDAQQIEQLIDKTLFIVVYINLYLIHSNYFFCKT